MRVPAVPSLDEVVSTYSDTMHLFVELETAVQDPKALLHVLRSCKPVENYHLLTLKEEYFARIDLFPNEALLLVAGWNNVGVLCRQTLQKHYGGLLGSYFLINNAWRDKLKQANQECGLGFVNSKNSLYREINRGIKWLFTNNPGQVAAYLKELCTESEQE